MRRLMTAGDQIIQRDCLDVRGTVEDHRSQCPINRRHARFAALEPTGSGFARPLGCRERLTFG
ncbi:UNVERIFIED_ORG: hypothetical protein M2193_001851 [Bradyrhizobium japonicum]